MGDSGRMQKKGGSQNIWTPHPWYVSFELELTVILVVVSVSVELWILGAW
jgi:hypothetical protein